MTLLCDAGALVALERRDRAMWRRLKAALVEGEPPVTHGGIVAQVWRGGHGRQALLSRALSGIDVVALGDELGRSAGTLLGQAGSSDAIDAALAALARDGDQIVTADPDDLRLLVDAADRHVDVVAV